MILKMNAEEKCRKSEGCFQEDNSTSLPSTSGMASERDRAILLARRKNRDAKKKQALRNKMMKHEQQVEETLQYQIAEIQSMIQVSLLDADAPADGDAWETLCGLSARVGLDPILVKCGHALMNGEKAQEQFMCALGVAILDVCEAKKDMDGGLSDLDMVVDRVRKRAGTVLASYGGLRGDVFQAVERLSVLGSGIGIVMLDGKEFVKCTATELSSDCTKILDLFHAFQGRITRVDAMDALKWPEDRVADCLTTLAREGMVMIDDPGEAMPRLYWCPACKYTTDLSL
jgi:hypothetical protein